MVSARHACAAPPALFLVVRCVLDRLEFLSCNQTRNRALVRADTSFVCCLRS